MKKINMSGLKKVLTPVSKSLLIYLAYFILAEIVISGGRYERDIYLWIVIFVLVIMMETSFVWSAKISNFRQAVITGLWYAIPIVALDYLITNLLLEKNSLSIFKSWETITLYALTLVIPVAIFFRKSNKAADNQVDELLTNHKPTL